MLYSLGSRNIINIINIIILERRFRGIAGESPAYCIYAGRS